MDFVPAGALNTLEDSRMLRIHRQDFHAHFPCQRHDDMAGRYQCFLICQSNILSRLHGCNSGTDTYHADDCSNYDLCLRFRSRLYQAFQPAYDFHLQVCNADF